ncbi:MAG: type III-B CRISPR-associated protein Cas10/Cmr2, partial [Thermoplasmata archaeon]
LPMLNGNFFFVETLSSEKATPLKNKEKRENLVKSLNNMYRTNNHDNENKPYPYYALLLMDGDNMGKIKKAEKADYNNSTSNIQVSQSLSKFSNKVSNIVKKFNGVTIYAGGDDVLAMLPADTAIDCAHELYESFKESFPFKEIDVKNEKISVSISAGIVISHYHQPLKLVYREAKYLLENVAKEHNGKNSIAVSVLKGSEKYLQWVTSWKLFDDKDLLKNALTHVADISKSMIYSTRKTLIQLSNNYKGEPGTPFDIAISSDESIFEKLLLADMLRNQKDIDEKTEDVRKAEYEKKLKAIIPFCMVNTNNNENNKGCHKFQMDGLFLLKFLSDIQKNMVI